MIYFKMEKLVTQQKLIKKDKVQKPCLYYYTGGRGRTGTSLRTLDFESSASANSATPANSNWGSWIRTNA